MWEKLHKVNQATKFSHFLLDHEEALHEAKWKEKDEVGNYQKAEENTLGIAHLLFEAKSVKKTKQLDLDIVHSSREVQQN